MVNNTSPPHAKPRTSKDTWDVLEKIFHDNKRSKTVEPIGELCDLDMGDLTVDSYFRKINSIATRLGNLGSNMSEEDIMTYAINGLSDKYDQARGHSSTRVTSSSPTVLLAPSSSCPYVRTICLTTLNLFVAIFLVATVRMEKGLPTGLAQLTTKGNLGEVSLERSQVRVSP
ncbi:hypothetical protein Tco_1308362 [Tanacetum coccineum]